MKLDVKDIKIVKTTSPKPKVKDESKLTFGKLFTDHMFKLYYNAKDGWHNPEIVPYGPLNMDPAACGLHYGQLIFEGLKCYRTKEGKLQIFRPDKNWERMNRSAERLCMPTLDGEFLTKALKELLKIDADWVPKSKGTSLYIRPTIVATEPFLGVHPAHELLFFIILSPVGPYYSTGFNPCKIIVEDKYTRAVLGGLGEAKTAANYAASIKSAEEAMAKGFTQVLWLDGQEHKYIEEVGTMNIMFKINDEFITPPLLGSILPGVTRDSVIQLLKSKGLKISERRISVDEVVKAAETGALKEVFGTGTAAVISPVGSLTYKDKTYNIGDFKVGEYTQKLYDELTAIQWGEIPDPFNWIVKIN